MRMKKTLSLLLALLLSLSGAAIATETESAAEPAAEPATVWEPLPMDTVTIGPAPKDECYISDTEYVDESISVKIYSGRYADTDYQYAHVKISHPSQLRTAPAAIGGSRANFHSTSTLLGASIAERANAVIAINGDYCSKSECTVVFRMGTQIRNQADGIRDLLIIDKNGDFAYLNAPQKKDYTEYVEAHQDEMYQVFCFGPVLVENGKSVIAEDYRNNYIGAHKCAQRTAIMQLGQLEYVLVTSYGNQTKGNKGMTIYEFAAVCEQIGLELNPEGGSRLAFNLDGGNSATMCFKRLDEKTGRLDYVKVNCPEIRRQLSDIVYFATLVK